MGTDQEDEEQVYWTDQEETVCSMQAGQEMVSF